MNTPGSRRIAIIGGGAAGASVLTELLARETSMPLHVDWYTGGGDQGRGVAYGYDSPRTLLNVRAASMSLFAGKPSGFLDFVQRTQPEVAGTDFLPRHRYGDYLQAEVARALRQGGALGHDVQVIPFAADALVPEASHLTIAQGHLQRQADAAVLAVGALPPRPLAGISPAALESGRCIIEPWSFLARAPDQSPPAHAVIIGSGLTAIDVVRELAACWPRTRFTVASRHGTWPTAHLRTLAAPDGDNHDWVNSMHDAPTVRSWLHLLREAASHGPWHTVIDSLRPHTPGLWQALPMDERARFLRHARWLWERARHRVPPAAADAIAELEAAGRLQRVRGRVTGVDVSAEGLQVHMRHVDRHHRVDADWVIQAAGLDTDVRHTAHPLLRQLLTNAHVQADPLGLGLRADTDCRLLHADQPWPHLFAIGSLLRGTFWESTAMPEIRVQARRVVDQLLA